MKTKNSRKSNITRDIVQIKEQKHGNEADYQVIKSCSQPAILGVRKPGLPLNLHTAI